MEKSGLEVLCKCGYQFIYRGTSKWYAKCSKCRSRIGIKSILKKEKEIFKCNLCKKTFYGKFGACFYVDGKSEVYCQNCSKKVKNLANLPEVMIVPITPISFEFVKKKKIYFHPSNYGRKGGKYIAFYLSQPISKITHIAKVSNILINQNPREYLKEISFEKNVQLINVYNLESIKKLPKPIERGNFNTTIQGTTNTTLEKLRKAKNIKDLLRK